MNTRAMYTANHPGFRELDVEGYAGGRLRLVVEDVRYAAHSRAWLRDPEVWRWLGGDYTDVSLEGEVARIHDILADHDAYHWIIELNGEPIGNINLHDIANQTRYFGERAASLTYVIGVRSSWGKGIATAVVQEVVQWACDEGGFKTIFARVLEQNPASIRVLTNSGFRPAGTEAYDGPDLGEPAVWERYVVTSGEESPASHGRELPAAP